MTHTGMVQQSHLLRLLLALAIALAAFAGFAHLAPSGVTAQFGSCMDREPNNNTGQANVLNCFNMQFNANINDENNANISTAFPHATVNGFGSGGGGTDDDVFSFTVTNPFTTAYFDIDGTTSGDLDLFVIEAASGTIAFNDDSDFVDAGSTTTDDPFLSLTLATPGTYYVVVESIPSGAAYTLHVTLATGVFAPDVALDDNTWSLAFDPDINDVNNVNTSTFIPHTSVDGVGADKVDWYEVTVAGPARPVWGQSNIRTAIFDIDYGLVPSDGMGPDDFDAYLKLYDANGNLVGLDDDHSPLDPGSEHSFDSLLEIDLNPGTYYLAVGRFPNAQPIPAGGTYTLQVSVERHAVP